MDWESVCECEWMSVREIFCITFMYELMMGWWSVCECEWMGECMCVKHDRGVSAGMKDVGRK